jgi:phytoene synthase
VDVDAAYAEAERITREQAKNFAWGIRLLPAKKRAALSAVYAMARRIDDIGDGDLSNDVKLELLAEARSKATDPGAYPDDLVCVALADAATKLPVPLSAFGELIDGCEMDVTGRTYDTLDELVVYCRCVAGSIGRLSLGVFHPGLDDARLADASQLADDLGIALQITNILRDIREDLGNGRVYLPKQDLALFGVTLQLREDGTLDPQDGALADLVRYEAARAMGWYDRGLRLIPYLDRRSAACVSAMSGIYRELLNRISAEPQIVMRERASLPTSEKVRVAGKSLITAHFDYQRGRKALRG